MAEIIHYPWHRSRSSMGARAANLVSKSAVIPLSLAFSVPSKADHHSEGILSRCHHLDTADDLAPISNAMVSLEDHSSMMARNDLSSLMPEHIRQSVFKSKDKLSGDVGLHSGHDVLMKTEQSSRLFKEEFTARVAFARHKAGYTQATMAEALGFGPVDDPAGQSKYHKYEKRSLMPHHLIPKFCALCEINVAWLYSGPAVARPVEKRGRKPKPSPRQKAA